MATTVQADDPLVGRLLDRRYRLTGLLARGGMATVYRGLDERLERPVAVKVMHRGLADDPDFVARFTREARSAARLSAPEVVAVYDQGRDEQTGAAYLVMEHIEGRDLRALLRDRGALHPARALSLLEPVLRALAAAHGAGIVHRDVKPENVLLGDDGRVKVADFGLARAVETSELTSTTGLLIGTVAYLAPEQIERGTADPRTDVYAAGVVLWEALTGAPPYAADTPMQVAYRHVHEDVPAPSTVVGGIPPGLDDLVVRATRRDPALRPPDAGAFLAEVRALRAELDVLPLDAGTLAATATPAAGRHDTLVVPRPVVNRSSPTGSAPPVPARRRRWRLISGLVVLVVLALLAAGGGWYLGTGRFTRAPAVLALTQADATARLRATGLGAALQPERFDETIPAGQVLAQAPDPGGRVRKGGVVSLVVSRGPDRRTVPASVVGSTQEAATRALTDIGLRAGEVTQEFAAAAAGTVLRTDPTPGTPLPPDTAVALVVSKGVEPLPVPDVRKRPQAQAQAQLQAAGFTTTVVLAFDEQVPAGTVVDQSPNRGAAGRGSTVTLSVSKGPDLQVIPQLVNTSRADAEAQLSALGLTTQVILLPAGPGTVRRIDPGAGSRVRKGSSVTLFVF